MYPDILLKKIIIPIVLHRVVPSKCSTFEDISLENLKIVFSQDNGRYLTISDNLDNLDIDNYYIVTFDDGYLSDYELVFPLIKKLDIVATFFINPENVGKSGFMDWQMIKEMSDEGMSIGSHGLNHLNMVNLEINKAENELVKSREIIEKNIGRPVTSFSFPYGQYNNDLIKLAKKCGYMNCFISSHGLAFLNQNFIPRNSINSKMNKSDILNILLLSNRVIVAWRIEDFLKKSIKTYLGLNNYRKLREWFFMKKNS